MILTKDMYVPALRWRQGEYQALMRLGDHAKDRIVPYITIPEVEFDFEVEATEEDRSTSTSIRLPRAINAKWGKRPAWVGVHPEHRGQVDG